MKLSVLIPVYNERNTIREVLRRVAAAPVDLEREILVVDDASTDGTSDVLRDPGDPRVRVFTQPRNRGKGAAIRTGLEHATGDLAIIQDADFEYDPAEYPALLNPILRGEADVVFGNRFHGEVHRVLYFWHRFGNWGISTMVNLATNMNFSDVEVGFKAFRTDVLKRLGLVSERFGIEIELAVKVSRLGVKVYEVPISYHGRTYAEGKKISWRDGIAALWHLLRFRFGA